jgi:nucleotide-binding universal stress UspA family protein
MDEAKPSARPRVVVGIDGSKASLRALEFAAEEAKLRGATLQVILAFLAPNTAGAPLPPEFYDELEEGSRDELDAAIERVPEIKELSAVVRTVVAETPTMALLAASHDATLLVVGSRGHGGFSSLLLGSVSHQCVLHAACPVVVVR